MIRIAVCDDENVIVNQIEHIISEVCKRESIPVNIDVFYSGRELKRQVTSGTKYDIIFLDIQMKGGDGITAAENIRKVDDNVLLIYVSGYDKYMMELFRLDVFGFIKKPIDEEILTKTFLETYQRVCSKMVYFTFSYKHEEYKILCKEILYFESNARKVTIYTQNGEHYTFNGKLSEIEQKMSDRKIPVVAATASDEDHLEHAFIRLGVSQYFKHIFTCAQAGAGKQSPAVYHMAAGYLDRNPEELYVFEDALYAIQTAKLAGYHTVGVYDEESKEDQEMIREEADIYMESFLKADVFFE